tara:strand:+ start:5264 stop:5782 length:519 start_codon:yes stop_codon:yes gene_type:complete
MGFFTSIGKKLSNGLHSAARVGLKITGGVSRVGHKIASVGKKVLDVVDRVPVVGTMLAPATGVARSAIGLVENVADAAGTAHSAIKVGDKLVRQGQAALKSGDKVAAMGVLRGGQQLVSDSKSNIEKARKIVSDSRKLSKMAGGAVGESKSNIMKSVVQARESARSSASMFG